MHCVCMLTISFVTEGLGLSAAVADAILPPSGASFLKYFRGDLEDLRLAPKEIDTILDAIAAISRS